MVPLPKTKESPSRAVSNPSIELSDRRRPVLGGIDDDLAARDPPPPLAVERILVQIADVHDVVATVRLAATKVIRRAVDFADRRLPLDDIQTLCNEVSGAWPPRDDANYPLDLVVTGQRSRLAPGPFDEHGRVGCEHRQKRVAISAIDRRRIPAGQCFKFRMGNCPRDVHLLPVPAG